MTVILIIAVLIALALIVIWGRGWLGIAHVWREMANAERNWGGPDSGVHSSRAKEYEENAMACERRAWPWRPKA